MKGPKAPETPDPAVQANAEASANRFNVQGPSGSQTWTQGGRVIIGYDSKGMPQYGTQQTQNIKLADSEQRQYDTRNQIAEQLLGGAKGQIGEFAADPFSYNDEGSKAAQASYQRQLGLLNPEFEKADKQFEQKLANQGIPLGSEAYNDAMRQHENDKNFALTQAAQQSESQGTQLALSERQQRYNELAAALGSEQLQPVNAFGSSGSPIDVSGAYAQQNSARMAKYNQDVNTTNSNNAAIITAIGAAAYSDERLKDDIEQVDELPSGEGVYEYHYRWEDEDEPKHTGVMAQEIERNYPDAVLHDEQGFKKVDYRKLIAQALAA